MGGTRAVRVSAVGNRLRLNCWCILNRMAEETGTQQGTTNDVVTPATLGKRAGEAMAAPKPRTDFGAAFKKAFGNAFMSVPLTERVLFARHLSVGIKAGMSMQDSLKLIQAQTKSKSFIKILDSIINDTANGMFLSASMQKFEGVFGQLFINIVRVGEQSGTLTENLNYLAKELKKKHELRSKVRGALIYPAVIFCATIGIVATLMIGVFPKILPVFANMKIKLPLTTRMLIAATDFMTSYTFWIIGSVIVLILLLAVLSKYEWFKHGWHHLLLRIPIVGKIAVKVNIASVSRILGLLLKSGTQVIEAVNITADALDNRVYRHELRTAGETLRRGDFFSIYLSKNPKMFPPIFTNMIQVGENTGNLTENLDYLSTFYEEDVDEVLKNLNSIIEPFLLLFMGLLVGFMALSVVTPIYSISQSLTL
jgi:type IV pilus assembly protein PilC